MKEVQVIKDALNIAAEKGCYNLKGAAVIDSSLSVVETELNSRARRIDELTEQLQEKIAEVCILTEQLKEGRCSESSQKPSVKVMKNIKASDRI